MNTKEKIPDPYTELKAAYAEGKTIQLSTGYGGWHDFGFAPTWTAPVEDYRIKPKTKYVKILCWYCTPHKQLIWLEENFGVPESWKRVPKEDKIIEVEE